MPAADGAFSWNSELPSGHNPFWIRDDALSGLGLHPGDAVSVDTRSDPRDGDLVVAEVEIEGDSQRLARRYFSAGDQVRLEPVGSAGAEASDILELEQDSIIVMGVIKGRLRLSPDGPPEEQPLA
jgi:SOS-response transcriptional repressor LexA